MRFEVSRVLDTIEQRLTTDVMLAQAVVDLGEVARLTELDGGRPVNLLRIGLAVDALSRYLVDAGAMVYGVLGRELLSEPAMTSKERMVLGRWADDGLIEVAAEVGDRAVELADFTGLPLIAVRSYVVHAERFGWLRDSPERVLRLLPRAGSAVLAPMDDADVDDPEVARAVAVGTAHVATADPANEAEPAAPVAREETVFASHGVTRLSYTRVVRRRFTRAEPSGMGVSLTARLWRCDRDDCPAFGEQRPAGQPLPRMRDGVPSCSRHGVALRDAGERPASFAISVVVDDLARHRFVVGTQQAVVVGAPGPDEPADEVVSVTQWTYQAARSWIGPAHVRLEVRDGDLVVTDVSRTGTVIWRRGGPDETGSSSWLRGESATLGDWDTVELYTGIELVRGDRRLATTIGRNEPLSVLVDAPTAALRQLSG